MGANCNTKAVASLLRVQLVACAAKFPGSCYQQHLQGLSVLDRNKAEKQGMGGTGSAAYKRIAYQAMPVTGQATRQAMQEAGAGSVDCSQ